MIPSGVVLLGEAVVILRLLINQLINQLIFLLKYFTNLLSINKMSRAICQLIKLHERRSFLRMNELINRLINRLINQLVNQLFI